VVMDLDAHIYNLMGNRFDDARIAAPDSYVGVEAAGVLGPVEAVPDFGGVDEGVVDLLDVGEAVFFGARDTVGFGDWAPGSVVEEVAGSLRVGDAAVGNVHGWAARPRLGWRRMVSG
jgi:hypothetical protein